MENINVNTTDFADAAAMNFEAGVKSVDDSSSTMGYVGMVMGAAVAIGLEAISVTGSKTSVALATIGCALTAYNLTTGLETASKMGLLKDGVPVAGIVGCATFIGGAIPARMYASYFPGNVDVE